MMRGVPVLLLLTMACDPAPVPPPPAKLIVPGDEALIGGTVSDGIRRLGLTLDAVPVVEEPPGICRGVGGKDAAGTEIRLYVDRHALGFSENAQGRLQELLNQKVIGVARRSGKSWATVGTVVWQFHSR